MYKTVIIVFLLTLLCGRGYAADSGSASNINKGFYLNNSDNANLKLRCGDTWNQEATQKLFGAPAEIKKIGVTVGKDGYYTKSNVNPAGSHFAEEILFIDKRPHMKPFDKLIFTVIDNKIWSIYTNSLLLATEHHVSLGTMPGTVIKTYGTPTKTQQKANGAYAAIYEAKGAAARPGETLTVEHGPGVGIPVNEIQVCAITISCSLGPAKTAAAAKQTPTPAKPLQFSDYQIGPFKLSDKFNMNLAKQYLGNLKKDGISFLGSHFYNFEKGYIDTDILDEKIFEIYATNLGTTRGIKPGDSIGLLIEKYGPPRLKEGYDDENTISGNLRENQTAYVYTAKSQELDGLLLVFYIANHLKKIIAVSIEDCGYFEE